MKAVVCSDYAPLEALTIAEAPAPALLPGSVRIALHRASVNGPDVLMPQGRYQVKPAVPFVPGVEGAGVVREVAPDVRGLAVGDRVMTYAGCGCYAEEVVVPAWRVHRMPEGMSFDVAAGFILAYGTAYYALATCGGLAAGQDLVVLGASGGLGLCAVELGKALGARVIAVASNAQKLAVCRAHGADELIDSSVEPLRDRIRALTNDRGAAVVFDVVGGEATEAALRGIAAFGRLLIVGYASGQIPAIKANLVLLKQAHVIGVSYRIYTETEHAAVAAELARLTDLWRRGSLKPEVTSRYPLERTVDALKEMAERRVIGKAVIAIRD